MGSRFRGLAAAAAVAAALAAGSPPAARAGDGGGEGVDVPFTRHVLRNGLTLVVHEDRKAPIVAVNVWYHVGSKNERPGRTGFAHLFEHLMFNGSENHDRDWHEAMASFGATGNNGTTNNDRTNYFETVPTGALDAVLWLESDRMGHLLGAVDQAKLDEQRGVVQNEKRQGENAPLGRIGNMLPGLTYPPGHPYSWSVIGSMEDLDAARLEDVRAWFRAYYGPNNAVLVVCGDVDAKEVVAKVERYFGDIPPGPPVARPESWIARRAGTLRYSAEERVPQGRLHKSWNTPGWGSPDGWLLELAAGVLARGGGSRLHQRLAWRERIATEVSAEQDDNEIGGQFQVWVTAAAGADLRRVEAVLDEELARFLADGPTEEELATEKTQIRASFLRRLERIGSWGGKADLLARSEVFGGRPDAWKERMAGIAAATPAAVREAARRWLDDGAFVLEVRPLPPLAAAKEGADRSSMPPVAPPADPRFPAFERTALPNGLRVVLARTPAVPVVRLRLQVEAGYAQDPPALPGTARLAGGLLTGGTATRSSVELRREADRLGAELEVETELEGTAVTLTAPGDRLDPSLAYMAEVVMRPAFPEGEIALVRARQLADIAQEGVDARGMTQRLLPRLLYGEGHPYAASSTGTGTAEGVSRITREDLALFHRTWFRPANATLIVTGDATMEGLRPLLQKHFGAWEAGEVPARTIPPPAPASGARILLLDRPGAPQSSIVAAQLVPPRGGPEEIPLSVLNAILGGQFNSRINLNLREEKHWSYGARSQIRDTRGARALLVMTSVQTDRTAESVAEMLKEIRGLAGERPATAAEIGSARAAMTLSLPGRWETGQAVAESIAEIVTYGLPDRWFDGHAARIRAVGPGDLAAAGRLLKPDALVWVVAGDRLRIEEGLRGLGIPLEVGDARR